MEKVYKHQEIEQEWYSLWEKKGYFTPEIDKKRKPFSIILPLPNANDPMHMGHALFVIQDIMIRYHRMLGQPTMWLPGADHAGIETQFVFEKHLAKEEKSRFDFDRNTLYKMVWDFVEKNREINKFQLKTLGFSLDWSRYHYSLEPDIVENVNQTFRKLHQDKLIYRDVRIVNFCIKCGTAFSELEVNYKEKEDFLYYLDYGTIKIATTRPETIFADVAVAVNPKDKKYKTYSKTAVIPIINSEIPIITSDLVEKDFGTGALKITPGYDPVDFEIGQKNNLEIITIMNRRGKMEFSHNRFQSLPTDIKQKLENIKGLNVAKSREATVLQLQKEGRLIKQDTYKHSVGTCYRCGSTIEPMVIPQWFVRMKPLAKPAIVAVKMGKTKIFPKKRFEKLYFDWLNNIHDWNISRQIVWGPRIPAWYCLDCNPEIEINFLDKDKNIIRNKYKELKGKYELSEISHGLQSLVADKDSSYQLHDGSCDKCKSLNLLQETDTFDTWFLSGQWPMNTLGVNIENPEKSSEDFKYFYSTQVLDTLWDILFFWVARMMMLGLYVTGKVPFQVIHIHSRVVDKQGQKMAKSRGNVINPTEISVKYGADSLRMALVMGVAPAGDIHLSEEKIIGMRNFTNKIWNMGRFLKMNYELMKENNINIPLNNPTKLKLSAEDKKLIKELQKLIKEVTQNIEDYYFGRASEILYAFIWHSLADKYFENYKDRLKQNDPTAFTVLHYAFVTCLKLLHPFMPFITEEINKQLNGEKVKPLIISPWPSTK